ncbi:MULTISPECIES: cysteine rich repeat-containing protein [unclassified Bradyrhizobium]|uniref:cysteine rich repeat-containing protein n=1 Tax=unclassified Bradyrhizobium TaxID=2631580 RepID=UPI002915DD25|nr:MULTISPECIES: cysteine rich repeat-containing protein [unclassified Bradyrhizobium]
MSKLGYAVLFTALVGLSQAAVAQALTEEQRTACKADYEKYCATVTPGGGRIVACLNKQYAQLADGCKKVLDASKK